MASLTGLFAGDLGSRFRWNRKAVLWNLAGIAAAAAGGWILSVPRQLPYSWYWFFFILILWFIFGIQAYLLRRHVKENHTSFTEMVRGNVPAIAGMTALIIEICFSGRKRPAQGNLKART